MATTLTQDTTIEAMKTVRRDLIKSIGASEPLSPEAHKTVLLAILDGVMMNAANHAACPALLFYRSFVKWIMPLLFGLIVAAVLGGVYAFQHFGIGVPKP